MSNFVAHTSYKYAKFDSQTKKFLFCLLSVKIGSRIAEEYQLKSYMGNTDEFSRYVENHCHQIYKLIEYRAGIITDEDIKINDKIIEH